jgi:hypothetical protein
MLVGNARSSREGGSLRPIVAVAADEADSTAVVAVAEVAEADEGAAMILIMAGSTVWTAMILTVNFPCLTITRLELLAKRSFMRSARKAVTVLLTRSTLVRKLPTTRTLSRMKGLHLLEMKRQGFGKGAYKK